MLATESNCFEDEYNLLVEQAGQGVKNLLIKALLEKIELIPEVSRYCSDPGVDDTVKALFIEDGELNGIGFGTYLLQDGVFDVRRTWDEGEQCYRFGKFMSGNYTERLELSNLKYLAIGKIALDVIRSLKPNH